VRIALIGQQKFGKSVLEAFLARGDTVAGVFCAPEKPGTAADPLRAEAEQRGLPLFQLTSLRSGEATATLSRLAVDLGVMAYVLQFAPPEFTAVPKHGMIQYHPSLLPHYRGPSSINWPIIQGRTETGLSIFRPTEGLDEGPVILQKRTPIGPDDTLGSVYFDRLYPLGVEALIEAADLVVSGRAQERAQDESQASYEGWCREAEAQVHWHTHVDQLYDLIRGCNPAPGAWTLFQGKKLQLFEARKHRTRTYGAVRGKIGCVTAIEGESVFVAAQGGEIELKSVKAADAKKMPAAACAAALGLTVGTLLGA
jgi:methionyl-tRNA formyltransferase